MPRAAEIGAPQLVMVSMTTTALVNLKKSILGRWRWKRSQGRPQLAFILTLDGVSSAP
jgi:hypothetical protein